MATADLQRQCADLLSQLKVNQVTLWQGLGSPPSRSSPQDGNLLTQQPDKSPDYARHKLRSIIKNRDTGTGDSLTTEGGALGTKQPHPISYSDPSTSGQQWLTEGPCPSHMGVKDSGDGKEDEASSSTENNGKAKLVQGEVGGYPDMEAMQDYFGSRTSGSLMEGGTDSVTEPVSAEDNTAAPFAGKPTTPTAVRRRRIIDKNVHVDSQLSDAELKELEKNTRGLNFSYSQHLDGGEGDGLGGDELGEEGERGEGGELTYQKHLVDRGNNRQLNSFIRDTTIRPKTILNSSQTHSYSKQGPGVSFQNSSSHSSASSLFRGQARERHMLGYDWIAALVHSDNAGLMEESESYFNDLREFRRHHRDECCNDFYMEGPFTLTQFEPPEVQEAIKDSKVQPYTVNDRLFTVPVTENLLGEPLDPENKENAKDPSPDNPRFVRVSIPRATLQLPYKVRPHRRRSFDASDSCALTDHCLMGWNAVSPATLPTASGVSLTEATRGVNPKHTTTMAEAEKTARMFHWPLLEDPSGQKKPLASLPRWRQQYLDTTLHLLPHDPSLTLTLSDEGDSRVNVAGSADTQRKTDQLLNSTYAMMYEMQKAREERTQQKI